MDAKKERGGAPKVGPDTWAEGGLWSPADTLLTYDVVRMLIERNGEAE